MMLLIAFVLLCAMVAMLAIRVLFFPKPGRSYEDYRQSRPDLVSDGKVRCHQCGGCSIWMKKVAYSPFTRVYCHTCRTCGAELYESAGR
jgi:hypothetical protein